MLAQPVLISNEMGELARHHVHGIKIARINGLNNHVVMVNFIE